MARFKATIRGQNGGHASRLGNDESGITAEASTAMLGVRVVGMHLAGDEPREVFDVFATEGSGYRHQRAALGVVALLGRVTRNAQGYLVFEPAVGVGVGEVKL